jgi:putative DNA primase/helicase
MTNSLPVIKDTSDSIWDRVQLLEWNVRIPDRDVDANLPAKLKSEWSGIFNWMLEGLRQVQQDAWDLRPPETVRAATVRYRSDSDILQRFLNDCCIVGADLAVPVRDLRPAFDRWAGANGESVKVSSREFNGWLRSKGFTDGNKKSAGQQARHWFGFGLSVTEVTGNWTKTT